jgi:hypothetical protein
MKLALKEKAIQLRKKGLSYREIMAQVPVAKSTISLWLRSVGLSKRQWQRLTKKKLAGIQKGCDAKRVQRTIELVAQSPNCRLDKGCGRLSPLMGGGAIGNTSPFGGEVPGPSPGPPAIQKPYNELMRTKSLVLAVIIIAIAILVGWMLWPHANVATAPGGTASYTIDGKIVTLVNGYAETPAAPGSASTLVTQYFGNGATGDLNGDGTPDVAFLLTQSGGGSGTFYYVVAALKTQNGYQGTNAVLLGDRIAPQTTEIRNGEVIVNYADRKPTDPMTAQPSIGVSKYLRVENGILTEVTDQ